MPPLPLSSHTCAAKRASTRARAVAGNCVILKPSEKVPMTMRRVADLLTQAGVPSGAFQMVQGGQEVVEALCDHRGIHALTFVGSSRVAKLVHARAVGTGKKALALGGAKNHLVAASDVRAPARPGISPDPCCCRPLLLPTRAAAGPCCCRPLLLPTPAAADPCCCSARCCQPWRHLSPRPLPRLRSDGPHLLPCSCACAWTRRRIWRWRHPTSSPPSPDAPASGAWQRPCCSRWARSRR